jgi:hypothetical protein
MRNDDDAVRELRYKLDEMERRGDAIKNEREANVKGIR